MFKITQGANVIKRSVMSVSVLLIWLSCLDNLEIVKGDVAPPVPLETVENNPFPGEKSDFRGFDRYSFQLAKGRASVICPKTPAPGKPWVWRGTFWGDRDNPTTNMMVTADLKLVELGFHVVAANTNVPLGHPDGNSQFDAVYHEMTRKFGLSPKPALMGVSRETLAVYQWAAANPDKVACIYIDNGVCDIKSWPGGKLVPGNSSKADGAPSQWSLLLKTFQFHSDAEALAYRGNPIDILEPLAKAKIPLLHVCGDSDTAVPYDENTAVLKERYEKLGGRIEVILVKGRSHSLCGLEDPAPIVDFIRTHVGSAAKSTTIPPTWDTAALSRAPATLPASEALVEGLNALWFEGLPYHGKPTKVFAYLGVPANSAGKVPGVVLVHGGGGTAEAEWVRKWNEKGYAAISFDTEGQIPERLKTADGKKVWRRTDTLGHPWCGGPARTGAPFGDNDLPLGEQWAYHAVADTLLATSLLAAQPEVDPNRIGIVGISWGSVICSIAGGIDKRLAFVVPQYIGGNLKSCNAWYGYMKPHPDTFRWDPAAFYSGNPTGALWLWINGINDFYGLPPMTTASLCATRPHSWMAMLPSLAHGQIWREGKDCAVNEIYAFADSVAKGGKPLPQITRTEWAPESLKLTWTAATGMPRAQFVYTKATPPVIEVAGEKRPDWAKVVYQFEDVTTMPSCTKNADGSFSAIFPRPAGMVAGWLNLLDERNLTASSEFLEP